MKFSSHRQPPERRVRELLRQKKWKKALTELEKIGHENERNYGTWNTAGDVHFRCKSSQQGIEAWRRAAEGYAREGLYENALALTKKILRLVPEETDLSLMQAELYLAMGYDGDSLASLRTYLRLCPQPSEPGLRAFFRKIIESNLYHAHLLEEIMSLFRETRIEDSELQKELEQFVSSRKSVEEQVEQAEQVEEAVSHIEDAPPEGVSSHFGGGDEGLVALDIREDTKSFAEETPTPFAAEMSQSRISQGPAKEAFSKSAKSSVDAELPDGGGRDHYDLGMVYQEMKLWDAAITEFEQARQDSDFRTKAELSLAECLMEKGDPRQAMEILESFEQSEEQPLEDKLRLEFVKGEVQEILGNFSQALAHFENIYGQQATYGNVEDRIRALKEKIVEEGRQ